MPSFKKAKAGAPTKCTPEITSEIANYLRTGAYIETAAAMAGVNKSTFYDWLSRGKKAPKSVYAVFSNAVRKAMAEAEMRDLVNIDRAAMGQQAEFERYPEGTINNEGVDVSGKIAFGPNGKPIFKKLGIDPDWSASAWRLERKYPKKWARTEKQMEIPEDTDDESAGSIEIHFVDPPKKKK